MRLPEIGDIITTDAGLELCKHYKLNYLIDRIKIKSDDYKSWMFDGCSGLPDEILGLFSGCNWRDITYKCCLPHDLCYAYGEPGNKVERDEVDHKFYDDLVDKAGMKEWAASAFLKALRIGGEEVFGLSFSWAFAYK
jgi:hypothetical protein